jgi:hypothetical protein
MSQCTRQYMADPVIIKTERDEGTIEAIRNVNNIKTKEIEKKERSKKKKKKRQTTKFKKSQLTMRLELIRKMSESTERIFLLWIR